MRRVPLGRAPLVVGTARGCDVVVRDRTVSARHCAIVVARGGIKVADLGSRNGTYVGGARIHEAWGPRA